MKKFKIKNKTLNLDKRDPNYNRVLKFSYQNNYSYHTQEIHPNVELFLEINKIPINLSRMRLQGLVDIIQIDDTTFQQALLKNKNVENEKDETKKKKTSKTSNKSENLIN